MTSIVFFAGSPQETNVGECMPASASHVRASAAAVCTQSDTVNGRPSSGSTPGGAAHIR